MSTTSEPAVRRSPGRRGAALRILALDVVGPLLVYRVCLAAGVPTVWSLVASGLPPGLGVFADWLRWRTLEVVGAIVLGGIAVSIALALVSDDPKVILLEGAAGTAAFGVACLVSLTRRRPLIFYFAQAFYGGKHTAAGAELDDDVERYAEARRFFRVVTVVWGVTYLVEAAVRAWVVQIVSTGTALTLNRTVPWMLSALLFAWTLWWGTRLRATRPAVSEG